MKRHTRSLTLGLLSAFLLFSCIGQFDGDNPESVTTGSGSQLGGGNIGTRGVLFVGKWQGQAQLSAFTVLEFTENGEFNSRQINDDPIAQWSKSGTFSAEGNLLTITYADGEVVSYEFTLNGDRLTLESEVYIRL